MIERRHKARLQTPFPAKVKGTSARGEKFEATATVDNVSVNGVYIRLMEQVNPGTVLIILLRLSTAGSSEVPAPCIASHARVTRVEEIQPGIFGTAASFSSYKFISSREWGHGILNGCSEIEVHQ